MPVIHVLTIDDQGGKKDGSWLNLADLRAYIDWLRPQYPDDVKTLDKLDEAIIAGMVNRSDANAC